MSRERAREGFDVLRADRETRSRAVAAEALEVRRARSEPTVEVERRDRAARALPRLVAAGDHHDRTVEAFDEPRGHDADHSLVPGLSGENVCTAPPVGLRPLLDLGDRLPQDPLLDLLALAVQLLEPGREPPRLVAVVREQEVERGPWVSEPPGGVDPRGEPERDGTRVDDRRVDVRRPHQRLQAGLLRPRERPQAGARERTVLVEQRHDVGDRRERDEVEVPVDVRTESAEQLVRDARAAELGEWVARRAGGDDRAVRQRVGRPVVVGHDHVEPELLRACDLLDRSDSAVDRDHECAALLGEPCDRLARDAVALVEAARQVPADVRAELAQADDRERRGADPVDVVVAVDADPLA